MLERVREDPVINEDEAESRGRLEERVVQATEDEEGADEVASACFRLRVSIQFNPTRLGINGIDQPFCDPTISVIFLWF